MAWLCDGKVCGLAHVAKGVRDVLEENVKDFHPFSFQRRVRWITGNWPTAAILAARQIGSLQL
jgi:hypothetical protein